MSSIPEGATMRYVIGRCGIGAVMLVLCLVGGGTAWVPSVLADEPTVDANSPDAVRAGVLEQQQGKRVKVKLVSGQDLDGWQVAKVGSQVVVFSELSGMEFSMPLYGWIQWRRCSCGAASRRRVTVALAGPIHNPSRRLGCPALLQDRRPVRLPGISW